MSKLIKLGNKNYLASLILSISEVEKIDDYRAISLLNYESDEIDEYQKGRIQKKYDLNEINIDTRFDYYGYEVEFIIEKENIKIGEIIIDESDKEKLLKEHSEKLIEWESKI